MDMEGHIGSWGLQDLARAHSQKRPPLTDLQGGFLSGLVSPREQGKAKNPGQTAGMFAEAKNVEKMLRDSTFYEPVPNEEKAAVYAAMAQDFQGTGHWYYCANGHPFTVGGCGMPMETSNCPQCGSSVGGQNRQPVEGVARAADFEAQFGRVGITH